MGRTSIGTPDWGDDLNADLNAIEALARSAVDMGTVIGDVTLDGTQGLYEMTTSGGITLIPEGIPGTVMGVRILGDDPISLGEDVVWDTAPLETAPGRLVLTHWPSGWTASAGGSAETIEVTPAAVTFNDTGNITTVPATTGVQYKRNGVNVSTGTISGESAGLVTYTAVAKTGYEIASGATVSWPHTYPALPGWNVWDLMEFTAADATAVPTVDTLNGRNYSAVTGNAFVHSNKVKRGDSGTDNDITLGLTGLPGDRMRQSIDYDLNAGFSGYVPTVRLATNLATGNITVSIGRNFADTDTTLTIGTDFSGTPTIDYEGGQAASGHPMAGTLMVEYDPDLELVSIFIDTVLIGTVDTSGLLYLGSPNPLTLTGVQIVGHDAYFDFDNHLIETFA